MAAKDYKICPALFNAFIAKVSKKDPNLMLSDRRVITENEIFMLINWKLERFCIDNKTDTMKILEEFVIDHVSIMTKVSVICGMNYLFLMKQRNVIINRSFNRL